MLRLLRKDDEERQVVYYGEGLGRHNFNTGGSLSTGTKMTIAAQALSMGLGSAIAEHILDAYRWLMNVHRKGDEIYVLGFSRGAYAAGCFCGLLEAVGLLPRENTQMIATGWEIYAEYSKDVNNKKIWGDARGYRTSFSKLVRIHFLGLWDCVASIGTGNEAPYAFPQHRGTVANVYHAMALDEGRNRFNVHRFSDHFSNFDPLYRATHSSEENFKLDIERAKKLQTNIHEVWYPEGVFPLPISNLFFRSARAETGCTHSCTADEKSAVIILSMTSGPTTSDNEITCSSLIHSSLEAAMIL